MIIGNYTVRSLYLKYRTGTNIGMTLRFTELISSTSFLQTSHFEVWEVDIMTLIKSSEKSSLPIFRWSDPRRRLSGHAQQK